MKEMEDEADLIIINLDRAGRGIPPLKPNLKLGYIADENEKAGSCLYPEHELNDI